MSEQFSCDVGILTALSEELSSIFKIFGGVEKWSYFSFENYVYYKIKYSIDNHEILIVATSMPKYGPEQTVLSVQRFAKMNPKILIMTGMCAGWEEQGVSLGDIIIADKAYNIQEGKKYEKEFRSDIETSQPPIWLIQWLKTLSYDKWKDNFIFKPPLSIRYQIQWLLFYLFKNGSSKYWSEDNWNVVKLNCPQYDYISNYLVKQKLITEEENITENGKNFINDIIKKNFGCSEPINDPEIPSIHYGTIASSPYVIEDGDFFPEQSIKMRKILALDMEIATFYKICNELNIPAFGVKSVCDLAKPPKEDSYHKYSSDVSALFAELFLRENIIQIKNLINYQSLEKEHSKTQKIKIKKIPLMSTNKDDIKKSFKNYIEKLLFHYENFKPFNILEERPIIEELSKFNTKEYYVPLKMRDVETYYEYDENIILRWITDEKNGLLLLGDFGSGKSTFCAKFACDLAYRYLENDEEIVPIFIQLRYLESITKESILNYLNEVFDTNWDVISYLIYNGKLLFILDGFDELINRISWEKTKEDFNNIDDIFCKEKSKAKVLISCRTHYFISDSVIWGEQTKLMKTLNAKKNYKIYSIEPFSESQIMQLLKSRTANADEIWNQINKTYNLRDLCKRPLLIDMILQTLPKLVAIGTNINAMMLYEIYTGDWINREDWRAQLNPEQKGNLMEKLSYNLYVSNSLFVSYVELRKFLEEEFGVKEESIVLDYYDYDIRNCSFFNRDGVGNYSFMHRSFLEYFVSRKIAKDINVLESYGSLKLKTLSKEILFFLSFLLNMEKKHVLFSAIDNTKNKSDDYGIMGGNSLLLLSLLNVNLEDSDFSSCVFSNINLSNISLKKCNMSKTKFNKVTFNSINFNDCLLNNAEIESCEFINLDIYNIKFNDSLIQNTNINNSSFNICEFNKTIFKNSNFLNSKIKNSNMDYTRFDILNTSNLIIDNSNLSNSIFINSKLDIIIFYKVNINNNNFIHTKICGMGVFNSNIYNTAYNESSITFSSLIDSTFDNIILNSTRLYRIYYKNIQANKNLLDLFKKYRIENKIHSVRKKNDDVLFRWDDNLQTICKLNVAIETWSLSDEIEMETLTKYEEFGTEYKKGHVYSHDELMATTLYVVMKKTNNPKQMLQISPFFNITVKSLARLYRDLLKYNIVKRVVIDPIDIIHSISDFLPISDECLDLTEKIILEVKDEMHGKNYTSVAAAALYLAGIKTTQPITQQRIATELHLTESTIRNNKNQIVSILKKKKIEF